MTKLMRPLKAGLIILAFSFLIPSWNLSATSEPPPYPPYSSPVIPGGRDLVAYLAKTYGKSVEEMWNVVYYASLHADETFPTATDILAIIAVESSFNSEAIHPKGPSVGLMQVNAGVHGDKGLKNPAVNISKGSKILKTYWSGNRQQTYVAYNAGPTGALAICEGQPRCSSEYSEKVVAARQVISSHWRKS